MTDHNHIFESTEDHGLSQHEVDGENISMSTQNIFGGETYVKDGLIVAESRANVQGGLDVYHDGQQVIHTEQNVVVGGQNIFHGSEFLGQSAPNGHHGHDLNHQGFPVVTSTAESRGFTTVMTHDDPLADTSDYHMTPLDLLAAGIISR